MGEDLFKAIGVIVAALLVAFALSFLFGWFVMLLWNWLIPMIFGLTTLTYWEAFGLTVLCGLLFKSTNTSSNK